MIRIVLAGILMTILCLGVQTAAALLALKLSQRHAARTGHMRIFLRLSNVLAVLFVGIVVQMAAWALAWRALGQFEGFEEAFYFSGVTFTSLGYGDLVAKGPVRVLAPLEATTGLIMFALLTAMFLNLIQREVAQRQAAKTGREPPDASA
jgi:hypothetical protein